MISTVLPARPPQQTLCMYRPLHASVRCDEVAHMITIYGKDLTQRGYRTGSDTWLKSGEVGFKPGPAAGLVRGTWSTVLAQ